MVGTLEFCDGCAKSKAKSHAVRKKTYIGATNPGEMVFVYTTGPFPEILIENYYCIGVVDDYTRYSWSLFTKTK